MRIFWNIFVLLVAISPVFAQHEHHQMPMPTKGNSIERSKNQAITSIPKVVRYDLFVKDTLVTFSNKHKRAIAVNGQMPMPTLTFTEGDTAEIYVHNELNEETSLHWR